MPRYSLATHAAAYFTGAKGGVDGHSLAAYAAAYSVLAYRREALISLAAYAAVLVAVSSCHGFYPTGPAAQGCNRTGKAVLVANALPFLRHFDAAPLIRPILFKTVVYWAAVFVARFLEGIIEYAIRGGTISGFPEYLTTHFTWHRFAAIQIWIFVLFLVYTFVTELNTRLGDGELVKMLFTRHSSEVMASRQ